jgi:hypothetical protein
METELCSREGIIKMLTEKSALKQQIFDNTNNIFQELKDLLQELSAEINEAIDECDKRIKVEYVDRGKFEAQIQVAGDVLIFSMHTNVFEFNREHIIWQNSYVQNDKSNSYCGIINIYNFLADSFKYKRSSDEGYLIGRIFINRENQYFVEGKRQISMKHNSFGSKIIDREALMNIIETAVSYALEFDLLVPPYDIVKIVSVDQMNTKIENSKLQTGKRLGYKFNSNDI